MSADAFSDFSDAYEAMIDWPKRLANEGPFFKAIFEQIGARRVLDAACGTGHHAALFHQWGCEVEGADLSPTMIERCRQRHGSPDGLRWVVRGFDQPADPPAGFDAVACLGNSLALAGDMPAVCRAVGAMMRNLRPGGVLIVQVANLWRFPDGPCTWQKCIRAMLPQGQSLIVKGIHRCGSRGYVDLVVTSLEGDTPSLRQESVPFLGFEPDQLAEAARAEGAANTAIFGSYRLDSFDREKSQDLILVAGRGE